MGLIMFLVLMTSVLSRFFVLCLHKYKNKKKGLYRLIIKMNTFFFRYFCHGLKPGEKI